MLFLCLLMFRLLRVCCVSDGQVGGDITWVYTITQLGLSGPPEY